MSETTPRTKDEALLDVHYQIRLAFLHERLYRRIRAVLAFTSLVSGSAALMSVLQPWPAMLQVVALVIAFVGFADLIGGFADKAARHSLWRVRLASVLAESADATVNEIDQALAQHDAACDDEIEGLRLVALNDNMRSSGHEDWVRPESRWHRLLRALA